jgi:hypothetical protein
MRAVTSLDHIGSHRLGGRVRAVSGWCQANVTVPVRYAVASGTSFGSHGDEQERIRTSLDAVTTRNPNIKVSEKVASNHGAILRKDFRAIADAEREVAALDRADR